METIKVPTALQSQKKVSEILSGMSSTCKMPCPVKDILHNTTDKWSTLVIMVLGKEKTLRFNELKTAISGISQKMLTVTLKNLERYGLVERKMYAQIPPKVEYTITPMGEEYLQHFVVMLTWACKNLGHIAAAQKKVDKRKTA
jgi:DNA-binding HxlR family transcriptional regulator